MNTRITCERYREALVDDHMGLLDPADRITFDEHRATCRACAADAQRDAWVCDGLQTLPAVAPPETSWQQVLAARRPARPKWSSLRLSLAGAVAFAVLATILFLHPFQHDTPPGQVATTAPTAVTIAAESAPFAGAHSLISASDMTGDPNRDVILLYGAPPSAKAGS